MAKQGVGWTEAEDVTATITTTTTTIRVTAATAPFLLSRLGCVANMAAADDGDSGGGDGVDVPKHSPKS